MKYHKITLAAFNKFYNMVSELKGDTVDARKFLKKLRKEFKTNSCIFGVIHANIMNLG